MPKEIFMNIVGQYLPASISAGDINLVYPAHTEGD